MTELQRLHDTDCTLLMGVLNITEDSFSDGGLWLDPARPETTATTCCMRERHHRHRRGIDAPRRQARQREGRARPCDRCREALIAHGAVVSIDTTRSAVAQAALNEGAQIINDVSGEAVLLMHTLQLRHLSALTRQCWPLRWAITLLSRAQAGAR